MSRSRASLQACKFARRPSRPVCLCAPHRRWGAGGPQCTSPGREAVAQGSGTQGHKATACFSRAAARHQDLMLLEPTHLRQPMRGDPHGHLEAATHVSTCGGSCRAPRATPEHRDGRCPCTGSGGGSGRAGFLTPFRVGTEPGGRGARTEVTVAATVPRHRYGLQKAQVCTEQGPRCPERPGEHPHPHRQVILREGSWLPPASIR